MNLINFFFTIANAQNGPGYTPLAPIQGFIDANVIQQSTQSLGAYVNEMFRLGVAAAGFLAVIMIIVGGIQYIGSDVVTSKSEARAKIENAILGLLLALSSYLILKTINQDFLVTDLSLEQQTIGVNQESGAAIIQAAAAAGAVGNPNAGLYTPGNSSGVKGPPEWNGNTLTTTYTDGTRTVLTFGGSGQGYLTTFDKSGVEINTIAVTPRDYNGANGSPTAYYTSNGAVVGAAGQPLIASDGRTIGQIDAGFNGRVANIANGTNGTGCLPTSGGGQCAAGTIDIFTNYYGNNAGLTRGTGHAIDQGNRLADYVNPDSPAYNPDWRRYDGPLASAPAGAIIYVPPIGGDSGGARYGHISIAYDYNGNRMYASDLNSNSAYGSAPLREAVASGRTTPIIYYYTGPGRGR